MRRDMNRWTGTGNLTADPELRSLTSGTAVCQLRLANNGMGRGDRDAAGYINITVYGKAGENCARYLSKGRSVAIDGRLDYHEWEQDDKRRHDVEIVANQVIFLPSGSSNGNSDTDEPDSVTADADDIPF